MKDTVGKKLDNGKDTSYEYKKRGPKSEYKEFVRLGFGNTMKYNSPFGIGPFHFAYEREAHIHYYQRHDKDLDETGFSINPQLTNE